MACLHTQLWCLAQRRHTREAYQHQNAEEHAETFRSFDRLVIPKFQVKKKEKNHILLFPSLDKIKEK